MPDAVTAFLAIVRPSSQPQAPTKNNMSRLKEVFKFATHAARITRLAADNDQSVVEKIWPPQEVDALLDRLKTVRPWNNTPSLHAKGKQLLSVLKPPSEKKRKARDTHANGDEAQAEAAPEQDQPGDGVAEGSSKPKKTKKRKTTDGEGEQPDGGQQSAQAQAGDGVAEGSKKKKKRKTTDGEGEQHDGRQESAQAEAVDGVAEGSKKKKKKAKHHEA